jgi:hypothetical protein
MSAFIVGSTANVAQTVAYNAIGCSVSGQIGGGYVVSFGPQIANPNPVQMPSPSQLGSSYASAAFTPAVLTSPAPYSGIVSGIVTTTPLTILVGSTAGLAPGNVVSITGIQGVPLANASFQVAAVAPGQITMTTSVGGVAPAYTGGGVVTGPLAGGSFSLPITAVSTTPTSSVPCTITVASTSNLAAGNLVQIVGAQGCPGINGTWSIFTTGFTGTQLVIAAPNTATYTGGGVLMGPCPPSFAPQLVPQLSQALTQLPAAFSAALTGAMAGSQLDFRTAAYLGWVAFFDYVRQGGT